MTWVRDASGNLFNLAHAHAVKHEPARLGRSQGRVVAHHDDFRTVLFIGRDAKACERYMEELEFCLASFNTHAVYVRTPEDAIHPDGDAVDPIEDALVSRDLDLLAEVLRAHGVRSSVSGEEIVILGYGTIEIDGDEIIVVDLAGYGSFRPFAGVLDDLRKLIK